MAYKKPEDLWIDDYIKLGETIYRIKGIYPMFYKVYDFGTVSASSSSEYKDINELETASDEIIFAYLQLIATTDKIKYYFKIEGTEMFGTPKSPTAYLDTSIIPSTISNISGGALEIARKYVIWVRPAKKPSCKVSNTDTSDHSVKLGFYGRAFKVEIVKTVPKGKTVYEYPMPISK